MIERQKPSVGSLERQLARKVIGDLSGRIAAWNEEVARLMVQSMRASQREKTITRLGEIEAAIQAEQSRFSEQVDALDGAAKNSRVVDVRQAMTRLLTLVADAKAAL